MILHQFGGQGEQLAYTGTNATDIIARLRQLPAIVHQHAGGFEVELASYDTIPIQVPSDEEREDRAIVLLDCARQKNDLLRAISDIGLAFHPNGRGLFTSLPPTNELVRIQGQYRLVMNALMAHAIKVLNRTHESAGAIRGKSAAAGTGFRDASFRGFGFSREDFQGAWRNTNAQGLIASMIIIPTDDTHAQVRATYQTFGENVVNAEWNSEAKVLKGATSLSAPGFVLCDSSFTIGSPNQAAQTLVVINTQGPHQGGVHGPFRPPPNPTYTEIFKRSGT